MKFNRKIRIGFPFSLSGGGPSTFMKRLRRSIAKQKLASVSYFIDPFTQINIFSNITRNIYKKPYVFRVDGIYFDKNQSYLSNKERNKPIFEGIEKAEGVVFQSNFGHNLITRFHKKITKPFEIVNNGVDINIFSPDGSNKKKELGIKEDEIVFLTSSKWRAHKRLKDIINIFIEFDKKSTEKCHLLILGEGSKIEQKLHPCIYNIGFVQPRELPDWYRTGDIFLFFSWLDNCPNSVIEAIACGLPVLCTNQGGTKEIVELTRGGIVVDADGEFQFKPVDLYTPPKPDYKKILEAINQLVNHYEYHTNRITRTLIDIDNVAKRYINFVEKVLLD